MDSFATIDQSTFCADELIPINNPKSLSNAISSKFIDRLLTIHNEQSNSPVIYKIKNPAKLKIKLKLLVDSGPQNLQIITDFDMTLSKMWMPSGSRGVSCHGIFEKCSTFTEVNWPQISIVTTILQNLSSV